MASRDIGEFRVTSDWRADTDHATIGLELVERSSRRSLVLSSVVMQDGLEVDEAVLAADLERVLLRHLGHAGPMLTLRLARRMDCATADV